MLRLIRFVTGLLGLALFSLQAQAEVKLHWGKPDSPYLREAKLEMDRGHYSSAIGLLLAERKRGQLGREAQKADLMLAASYLNYGMHEEAALLLAELANERLSVKTMGTLWLELANMRYRRGYYREAAQALTQMDDDRIPYDMLAEKFNLLGLIYLHQGRERDAIAILRSLRGDGDWTLLGRYNLGTTLIRNNQIDVGTETLEDTLRLIPEGWEMSALRDRTMYSLGYVALQTHNLNEAMERFRTIRLESPVSNRALLGMGLAYASAGRHKDAITVWQELADRHPSDPSVLESLLAIPLSFMELGGQEQSVALFEKAMDIYEHEVNRINDISLAIEDGSLINQLLQQLMSEGDGFVEATDIPGLPEFRYLQGLYESHPFQVAVNNYRDMRLMELRLRQWSSNIGQIPQMSPTFRKVYADRIAASQTRLIIAAEELKQHISRLALAELERRRGLILAYSRHAMFAVAQTYDNRSFALDRAKTR